MAPKIAKHLHGWLARLNPAVSGYVSLRNRVARLSKRPLFGPLYVIFALAVLAATSLTWTILSAKLQNQNADQLVDPHMFASKATLQGATLPGAHAFLLKWPLFWLTHLGGITAGRLIVYTVLTVLLTIGLLVFLLWRVDRRPLVFGTLCLALASVLLLIPAQPAPGALLPVNMAMLATRNLEYILYIICLYLVVSGKRLLHWRMAVAVVGLGVLFASDKLFLVLAGGAALALLLIAALTARWRLATVAARWLVVSIAGALLAAILLAVAQRLQLVQIAGAGSTNPYGLSLQPKQLLLGLIYAVLGLLTNFGANPGYDGTVLRSLPRLVVSHLVSLSGVSYLVNMLVFIAVLIAVVSLFKVYARKDVKHAPPFNRAGDLACLLVASSVVALAVFVVTNHYYAVDARYLTIALFAGFFSLAVYLRSRDWQTGRLVIAGGILTLSCLLALPGVASSYFAGRTALSEAQERNALIVEALQNHPVQHLVGDYWRVLPITLSDKQAVQPVPLANCTTVQTAQSSQAWTKGWQDHSFAYLLNLERGPSGYPACSINSVVQAYGHPNASLLIAGSYAKPKEMLLLYDRGVHRVPTNRTMPVSPTIAPIALDDVPAPTCEGPSVLNIVAHQDDDLLFINPDTVNALRAGDCVHTVYLTAGDAGQGSFYWLSRESGSEAAYDEMDGPGKDIWTQRTVELAKRQYVSIVNPSGNRKLSLVFMHLPDGGIHGDGFAATHHESLSKLQRESGSTIHSVDGQSSYTHNELVNALVSLMTLYKPSEIHTQSFQNESDQYPDHSDHLAVGAFVQEAYAQYEQQQYDNQVSIPIRYYIGYPIHAMAANINDGELAEKQAAFLAYAAYDRSVCGSAESCLHTPTYGAYLQRQYVWQPE